MKPVMLLFLLATMLLASCGPSAQEAEQKLLREIAERQQLEATVATTSKEIAEAEDAIIEGNGILEVQRVRLNRIEEWQFGRSASVRDQQIMDQTRYIQEVEANIQKWKDRLLQLQAKHENLTQALQMTSHIETRMESAGVK